MTAGTWANLSAERMRLGVVLIGGAAGALARGGLAEALPHAGGQWPWATFIANLLGALFLGWLLTRLAERVAPTTHWRPLLGTGSVSYTHLTLPTTPYV